MRRLDLPTAVVVTLLATTTAVSILFLLRRLQGQVSSLSPIAWLFVTLLAIGSLFLVRRTWYAHTWLSSVADPTVAADTPATALYRAFIWWSPTICQLLLGLALTQANSSRLGLVVWWSSVVAGELWWWTYLNSCRRKPSPQLLPVTANQRNRDGANSSRSLLSDQPWNFPDVETADDEADESSRDQESLLLPTDVDQQLAYYRSSTGLTWVEGIYRVRFIGTQKLAEIHVAFCPPLSARPDIDVQWLQGGTNAQTVQWQVVQAEPYGGRVEVRRRDNSESDREVILMIVAKPS